MFAHNSKHCPTFNLTTPWEFVLDAGEMLIIPGGWPHAVENLELTVAIAGNFVDERKFEKSETLEISLVRTWK